MLDNEADYNDIDPSWQYRDCHNFEKTHQSGWPGEISREVEIMAQSSETISENEKFLNQAPAPMQIPSVSLCEAEAVLPDYMDAINYKFVIEPSLLEDCQIGFKDDAKKARVDLLVPEFITAMGHVLGHGVKKYQVDNWQHVDNFKARYTGAAYRHLLKYMGGELIDPDSGDDQLSHLAMVATNIMFLYWGEMKKTDV